MDKYLGKPYWITEKLKKAQTPPPTQTTYQEIRQEGLNTNSAAYQTAQTAQVEQVPDAGTVVKIALHDSSQKTYLYVASIIPADSAYVCTSSNKCSELSIHNEYSGKTFFSGFDVTSHIGSTISVQAIIEGKPVVRNLFIQRRKSQ